VWLAELDKRRPVVVLTRDPLGRHLHSVIVGPVTSTVRGLSTEVEVGAEDGVRVPSVVNLDNLQLMDRRRLVRRLGRVRPATLGRICDAVGIAVGCA
jgi:mRNA interferase MazF